MRNILLLTCCLIGATSVVAQTPATSYRATPRKINDLVHTRLDVRFDYAKRYLYGQEWVTLKPHGYPTDSLQLDAKGMNIKRVVLMNGEQQVPLKYAYDQSNLRVNLGKTVTPGTAYTIYIEYTAKPDELKLKGSDAIGEAKGLYFINPDSAVAGKPVQIWTQGESESNSAWFPTIDKPNQKMTSEISMTVPAKYVTLSNGALVSQKSAGAGLRTDIWKMELPHAPYLFMMAVGDFKIHKETWRGKEVSYYLEPQYAGQAQAIFGKTPAMLEFFSQRLGVEYPWNKYAQVVVRDYVAGAMENTTASLFGPHAQGTAREILDWDYMLVEREVAHELFHHWFGDYVTAESWSNLTVNESFANFSEVLWAEHAYGPDAGAAQADRSLRNYLRSPGNYDKQLARYHYADKEDMFDNVTYQKGGSILNMLRTYLGSDVFFAGLRQYLTRQAFGVGEPHQLRLALEDVSGQDLSWFFNQWYYRAGHPVVTINYAWDAAAKVQTVTVKQSQAGVPFQLPLAIDYYVNGQPRRQRVMMTEATQTFRMPLSGQPDLVNVDAEKTLVWQKQDNKPLAAYAYQYRHAPLYLDRREALSAAKTQLPDPLARQILVAGLTDASPALREMAVELLDLQNPVLRTAAAPILARLAATDAALSVRAVALKGLGTLKEKRYVKLFEQALSSKSYRVQGAALQGLLPLDAQQALARTTAFEADNKGALSVAMVHVYGRAGSLAQWPLVRAKYDAADPNGRLEMLSGVAELLGRLNDPTSLTEGITRIKDLTVRYKPYLDADRLIALLRQVQQQHATRPTAAHTTTLVDQAVAEIQAAK
ncbi:M1 family metallopeptidase [Hymenobacter norwichensis]|uniref:M1 family metallopeptidase n=1 Tax=Hymenobacter norwichensis TaxID=223903 RepID=UPI0003B6513C|nr:M1 family aminopeptidase [Hymenobacter norwichensis]